MKKNLILLAIINLILFACQPNQKQTFEQPEKVVISEQKYKELEETYTAAKAIYEFSNSHKDYGSYITSEGIDLEKIIHQYTTLKSEWETIKTLNLSKSKSARLTELLISSETIQALEESAIGLTLKLDKFLGQHIRDLNKKYLTDELIRYYKQLRKLGKITDDTRLQELIAWKNELNKPRKQELSQKYPTNVNGIISRYKDCKPCKVFYQKTQGSNIFIDEYSEDLIKAEQFPYILVSIKKLDGTNQEKNTNDFGYDDELFILLDKLCDLQSNCHYKDKNTFEKTVNKIAHRINKLNFLAGIKTEFGSSRKLRIEMIQRKAKSSSKQGKKINM